MAEKRNMAMRHMAEQYMTPSEEDTPQTSKIVLEQVSEKRTDRKTESTRPILAAFPGDETSEDEKYMADRHMAMQHMAEQYTTPSEEDTPQTLEKVAPEEETLPIEFVTFTAFCLLNHYIETVLKVHGYSVNLYLTKIVTTAMSMLFGNWILGLWRLKPFPPHKTNQRSERPIPRKKFLIAGLLAAVGIAQGTAPILFGNKRHPRRRLTQNVDKFGMLATEKLDANTLKDDRQAIEAIPSHLMHQGEVKSLVVNTGDSVTVSGFRKDFIRIEPLSNKVTLQGIAGASTGTHSGPDRYEVIDTQGNVQELNTNALYIPDLKC